MCWIVPDDSEPSNRMVEFLFQLTQLPIEKDKHRALRSLALSSAAFGLCLRWEGVGRMVLRLHGTVPPGKVRVLVGEYAGVEQYCMAVLQHARAKDRLSAAFHGLFSIF